jgi:uncharacterized protein (TIGR02246 family)
MRSLYRPLLPLLLLAAASMALAAAAAKLDPKAAVVDLLQKQAAAWSHGDIEGFCSVYADDALFLSLTGVARGRQAVLERYQKRYPDAKAMGTLTLEPIEVRLHPEKDPKAASVAARWKLAYPDKPAAEGLTLLVLRKVGERWEIVQDASM